MSLRDTSWILFVVNYLHRMNSTFFQIRSGNVLFKYDRALGILMFSFLNNVYKIQFFLPRSRSSLYQSIPAPEVNAQAPAM